MTDISSAQNPQIKDLVRLRDRRHRDRSGRFVIEGYRELGRAIEAGLTLETLYVCPELFLGPNEPALIASIEATGTAVTTVSEQAFRKASYRDRPEGLLATAPQPPAGLDRIEASGVPLLLVVESIEKPGNLGTMLRTADAAGVRGVIVCDPTTDLYNPNVVRASLGMLFVVPVAVASTADTVAFLRRHHIRTVATTPSTSLLHWDADLTGPIAVIVGTEQYGLSDAWLRAADTAVRIPMAGRADSLNAAMAAGVVLFEAARQRAQTPR